MDESGHRKKATEPGVLTLWRQQREEQVKTWEKGDQAKGTHILETTEEETGQDTEIKRSSKGHSQSGGRRGRDKSGHRKKATEKGVLTNWRPQREGQVRT